MKILLVNKYNYLRSGSERYLFNLERLLRERGHQTAVFAMAHPDNRPARYAAHFVPHLDFHHAGGGDKLRAAGRVLWSTTAARRMAAVLDDFQPDLVHLGNIYHQLSPAILPPISRRGIPIVQTLNDYKLICPNYLLYTDGAPCRRCRGGRYWQALRHRCLHDSIAWSGLAALEMTLHKGLRVYERHVAQFLAPSQFMRQTVVDFGIRPDQVTHLPYFLFPDMFAGVAARDDGYFVYTGRLSPEKGLLTLLAAMRGAPAARLLIVGTGPQAAALAAQAAAWRLDNVTFSGYLAGAALADTLAGARFAVLPAEWYENAPLAVSEAQLLGKAALVTAMGGLPELVTHEDDGLVVPPADPDALADAINRLWRDPAGAAAMGARGRAKVLAAFGPERHYERLRAVYGLS